MNKQFSNALLHETSPYLLQHAHNPVNWYPWGDGALQLARDLDLPILLSIGYSACHWCHVMERESFENEEVAQYMNEHFINIKIDREERPDLDQFYMDAVQAMSGSGGWPLNVFLTTDTSPFYGGTYFPPVRAFNRSSWLEILQSIVKLWLERRDEVESQAKTLVDHLKKSNSLGVTLQNKLSSQLEKPAFEPDKCRIMTEAILKNADVVDGGFGQAPKFLQTFSMQYLLAYFYYSGDAAGKNHVVFTLQKMLHGGIYDQLGGGISRYSTDNAWLVPHFEKMLYDNALFLGVLSEAYQVTGLDVFEKAIMQIFGFLQREMKDAGGGYYTAIDADSEGVEGKFYVWQKSEIVEALGEDADIFCNYYNVKADGNWEETNILHITGLAEDFAASHGMSESQFEERMEKCRRKLLQIRSTRVRPGTDDKILLSSNALLLTAFCKAYAALQEESIKVAAVELYQFIQSKLKVDSADALYMHTYKAGEAKVPAFLDDYSYLMQACIHLQEITSNQDYLTTARQVLDYVLSHYTDEQNLFFYYTHKDHKDLMVRKVDVYDGATPSANAVMVENLFYLGIVFDEQQWHIRAHTMLQSLSDALTGYPSSFAVWANAYQAQAAGYHQVVITGLGLSATLSELLKSFIPNKILQSSTTELPFPLLSAKAYESQPLIYLCENYTCRQPVKTVGEIMNFIRKPVFSGT